MSDAKEGMSHKPMSL